jgi:hypothetical protein
MILFGTDCVSLTAEVAASCAKIYPFFGLHAHRGFAKQHMVTKKMFMMLLYHFVRGIGTFFNG